MSCYGQVGSLTESWQFSIPRSTLDIVARSQKLKCGLKYVILTSGKMVEYFAYQGLTFSPAWRRDWATDFIFVFQRLHEEP
jgi:hypothetical protein